MSHLVYVPQVGLWVRRDLLTKLRDRMKVPPQKQWTRKRRYKDAESVFVVKTTPCPFCAEFKDCAYCTLNYIRHQCYGFLAGLAGVYDIHKFLPHINQHDIEIPDNDFDAGYAQLVRIRESLDNILKEDRVKR